MITDEDEKKKLELARKIPSVIPAPAIPDLEEDDGTFSKRKLKNKTLEKGKGYHLNTKTYELEECKDKK
jgi:hypothetical protein